MLHVLLLILKILGLILASVLGLLIVLLLLLLFVPFRYRGFVSRREKIAAQGRVSWLFHFLSVPVVFENGELSVKIKLLGIPIKDLMKNEEELEEETAELFRETEEEADWEETRLFPEKSFQEEESKATEEEASESEKEAAVFFPESGSWPDAENESEKRSKSRGFFTKFLDKLRFLFGIPGRILKKIRNLKYTFQRFCVKIKKGIWKIKKTKAFLKDERTRLAFHRVFKELKVLWKAACPRKIRGELHFGMEDPALTGEILGGISIFYPLFMDNVKVLPDFEQSCLEGELLIKGRIRLAVILGIGLRLLMDKNVRYVYRKLT